MGRKSVIEMSEIYSRSFQWVPDRPNRVISWGRLKYIGIRPLDKKWEAVEHEKSSQEAGYEMEVDKRLRM